MRLKLLLLLSPLLGNDAPPPAAALSSITEKEVATDVAFFADPGLEGRDTPSAGLEHAATHIEDELHVAGLKGLGKDGSFRLPWEYKTRTPDASSCALQLQGATPRSFVLGTDFEPVPGAEGSATGEVVFLGFGIEAPTEKYDDVRGELKGRVALIVDGEPRTKRLFDGPEVSPFADLFDKLDALAEHKVAGVLIVRRPAADEKESSPLSFRSSFAQWNGVPGTAFKPPTVPALEITPATAEALVGQDVLKLLAGPEKAGEPPKRIDTGQNVTLGCGTLKDQQVSVNNLVAVVPGTDAALGKQYVVVGAHYDHIGVDARGRVGCGADDNASGTSALLQVAQAFADAPPRRSVLLCFFCGEEKGLLGSAAFCKSPPVPRESLVAMVNMDQIGRGKPGELAMLGLDENPTLEPLLDRALKLSPTKIGKVVRHKGQDLFNRADHFSFHQIGVPALFLFEGLPIDDNKDYHTWRDTADLVDVPKIAGCARLAFNCAWLLANDDKAPPPPKKPKPQ
jgi:Peptidase family M28